MNDERMWKQFSVFGSYWTQLASDEDFKQYEKVIKAYVFGIEFAGEKEAADKMMAWIKQEHDKRLLVN